MRGTRIHTQQPSPCAAALKVCRVRAARVGLAGTLKLRCRRVQAQSGEMQQPRRGGPLPAGSNWAALNCTIWPGRDPQARVGAGDEAAAVSNRAAEGPNRTLHTHTAREVLLDDPDEAREEALRHVDRGDVGACEPAAKSRGQQAGSWAGCMGAYVAYVGRARRQTDSSRARCTQRAEAGDYA